MFRSEKTRLVLIATIVMAFLAVPAGATALTYTDPSAWQAAVTSFTTLDFAGIAPANGSRDYGDSNGLLLGDIRFIGPDGSGGYTLFVRDAGNAQRYNWGSGAVLEGPDLRGQSSGSIQVNLPTGTNAFAAYVMAHNGSDKAATSGGTLELATSESFSLSTSASARTFVGVISTVPINWARFKTNNSYTMLDDFSSGSAATQETPEAETLFLGGSGLLGLWLARRMRRHC